VPGKRGALYEGKLENAVEEPTEFHLVQRAQEGDEGAFEEIVRLFSPRIFRVVGKFFRDRSQVEDIAQEVFLKAFTQLKNYEGRGSFEGWLTRIATNLCLNELRTRKRHPESLVSELSDEEGGWLEEQYSGISTEASPERALIVSDLAEKLLGSLSADDRVALTMIDGEGMSIKEVADITGWSLSKVKVQAFRARRKLRKLVEKLNAGRAVTSKPVRS
jgi:RNA polymerase sigma-70 factor (ECF subfamily)